MTPHVLMGASLATGKLSELAREVLESPDYRILVSTVSTLELWRKVEARKLDMKDPVNTAVRWATSLHAEWLSIEPHHVLTMTRLPVLHKDPFDRMLLAQSVKETIPLLTAARPLYRYAEVEPTLCPARNPGYW